MDYSQEFTVGQIIVWPNGTVGPIVGIDEGDDELLDSCGGWSRAYDCDTLEVQS
jgi:hypothetical protein